MILYTNKLILICRKVDELFGTCARPVIGWQIDPFGHARESASLMAQMGFDGLFFARLDYQDKLNRLATKTTEMIWQASENLGKFVIHNI
jgi:lysosomal alpha-mannosidase